LVSFSLPGIQPTDTVSVWLALDDADKENGCLRIIPGTHKTGLLDHGTSKLGGNLLSIQQDIAVSSHLETKAVDIELKAGQASFHHGLVIHGSQPNQSDRRRCGEK